MTALNDMFAGLTAGLKLGTADQRNSIREAVQATCRAQGYNADVASFNDGTLILKARPAEAYLLRMDVTAVREALNDAGVGDVVQDVNDICRL